MKILVLSDIHNKKGIISRLASKIKPDYVFFLGDGLEVFNEELINFDSNKIHKVKGNCDPFSKEAAVLKLELFEYAKKESCEIVCFGHTHKAFNERINSIKFFNPGALGDEAVDENSFGIIELDKEKISFKIEKI